jgi:hypothetical protein
MSADQVAVTERVIAIEIVVPVLGQTFHCELLQQHVLFLLVFVSVDPALLGLANQELWGDVPGGSLWPKVREWQICHQVYLLLANYSDLALYCLETD